MRIDARLHAHRVIGLRVADQLYAEAAVVKVPGWGCDVNWSGCCPPGEGMRVQETI